MAKHTPGPWKVITLDGDTYINPDRDQDEYALIAKVSKPKNANVLAAAPELLEAAKSVCKHSRMTQNSMSIRLWRAVVQLRKAIAKAEED